MINRDLIINLINLIDLSNIELTRIICECFYYFSINSNLLQFIDQNGLKKFQDLLEQTNDPSIFSSVINILTEFIDKNENLSNDILLNLIKFLQNSSDKFYFSRLIKSLNELTKFPQTIKLFKQENIFPTLISHLENSLNNQSEILSILEQCGKDPQAAKLSFFFLDD